LTLNRENLPPERMIGKPRNALLRHLNQNDRAKNAKSAKEIYSPVRGEIFVENVSTNFQAPAERHQNMPLLTELFIL
jgi:hypothetical protein